MTLAATDADGDALTYAVAAGARARHAQRQRRDGRTYTPAAGYSGADSFTYSASDGSATSNAATVSHHGRRVNRAPVATTGSLTTDQGTAAAVTLQATDPDGDALDVHDRLLARARHPQRHAARRARTRRRRLLRHRLVHVQGERRQAESNVATVSITVSAPLTPPPPTPDEPKPQKTEVADPCRARCSSRRRRAGRSSRLTDTDTLRFGVVFDTTKGTLRLTVAKDRKGDESTLDVTGGQFVATQDKTLLTTLTLTGGNFGVCGKRKLASVATTPPPKKKSVRHLWGNGKGRFRTKGRYSAATVRGTHWLTDDRCDGTLTYVKRGTVSVLDYPEAPHGDGQAGPQLPRAARSAS